ncbi:unnamed protein product, partial [Rotaria magnacalcarata]
NDILQKQNISDSPSSCNLLEEAQMMIKHDVSSRDLLPQLGTEYQFRVTVLEASQISSDYAD